MPHTGALQRRTHLLQAAGLVAAAGRAAGVWQVGQEWLQQRREAGQDFSRAPDGRCTGTVGYCWCLLLSADSLCALPVLASAHLVEAAGWGLWGVAAVVGRTTLVAAGEGEEGTGRVAGEEGAAVGSALRGGGERG